MNMLRSIVLLMVLTIGFTSCAVRRGYDRPMHRQRLPGWHRGGGFGHGPGSYTPPRRYRY